MQSAPRLEPRAPGSPLSMRAAGRRRPASRPELLGVRRHLSRHAASFPLVPVERAPAGWRVAGRGAAHCPSAGRPARQQPAAATVSTAGGWPRPPPASTAPGAAARRADSSIRGGVQAGQPAHDGRLQAATPAAAAWSEGRATSARIGRATTRRARPARGALTALGTIQEGARRAGANRGQHGVAPWPPRPSARRWGQVGDSAWALWAIRRVPRMQLMCARCRQPCAGPPINRLQSGAWPFRS
jgi:hypothetical protein